MENIKWTYQIDKFLKSNINYNEHIWDNKTNIEKNKEIINILSDIFLASNENINKTNLSEANSNELFNLSFLLKWCICYVTSANDIVDINYITQKCNSFIDEINDVNQTKEINHKHMIFMKKVLYLASKKKEEDLNIFELTFLYFTENLRKIYFNNIEEINTDSDDDSYLVDSVFYNVLKHFNNNKYVDFDLIYKKKFDNYIFNKNIEYLNFHLYSLFLQQKFFWDLKNVN